MARFKSRRDGQNRSKRSWMCLDCKHISPIKFTTCECSSKNIQYFASTPERTRCCELLLQVNLGQISNLEIQPTYPLLVNGIKVCSYRADFTYIRDGKCVIEDVKPKGNFIDPEAKIKIALFNAIHAPHNLEVQLIRRS